MTYWYSKTCNSLKLGTSKIEKINLISYFTKEILILCSFANSE